MKIEVGLGGVWNEEEKATVVEVLGRGAFDYLVANSISNENLLTAVGSGQNLKNKLSDFVERRTSVGTTSSSENFQSYTNSIRGLGFGCCREPREGEEVGEVRIVDDEKVQRKRKRKRVL